LEQGVIVASGRMRTIASDVGHIKEGIRHWEFQVNGKPVSKAAKRMLKESGDRGTHKKYIEDTFDTKSPPEFEEWKKSFLHALGKL